MLMRKKPLSYFLLNKSQLSFCSHLISLKRKRPGAILLHDSPSFELFGMYSTGKLSYYASKNES